jgi:hypothetical protein
VYSAACSVAMWILLVAWSRIAAISLLTIPTIEAAASVRSAHVQIREVQDYEQTLSFERTRYDWIVSTMEIDTFKNLTICSKSQV